MDRAFLNHFEAILRDGGKVRPGGPLARDLLPRRESGPSLKPIADDLGLGPPEMIAALAFAALGDGRDDSAPPLVQGRTRSGSLGLLSETALADLFPGAIRPARLALSAGLLQVFDAWEASHKAAQEADDLGESNVSACWHAIAHRREPDPGNAAYWFRRVGRHAVFQSLAEAAGPLLADHPAIAGQLLPRGVWNPFAFIDLSSRARGDEAALARSLQRLEMLRLLEASLPA